MGIAAQQASEARVPTVEEGLVGGRAVASYRVVRRVSARSRTRKHEISCDCLGFSVWTPRATPPHRGASIWKGRQMTTARKPAKRPANTHFSSGPCAKRPGWSLKNLEHALLGRSHRAK